MPLLIDQYSIDTLNGPISLCYMRPKKEGFHPLLLFGDLHTIENFRPCDNPNCFEIQTDFAYALNEFAKTVKTEFYMEGFMLPELKEQSGPIQDIYYGLRNDPVNAILYEEEKGSSLLKAKELYHDNYKKSNLTEMMSLYYSCFYSDIKNEQCPFKNIDWQFADIRTTIYYHINKYNGDVPDQYEYYGQYIHKLFHLLLEQFNTEKTTVDLYAFLEELPRRLKTDNILSNQEICSFLHFAILFFQDYGESLIPLYLSSYTIKKQYDKLSEPMKKVMTEKSFIDFFKWRFTYFESQKIVKEFYTFNYDIPILDFLTILLEYYTEIQKYDFEVELEDEQEIEEHINLLKQDVIVKCGEIDINYHIIFSAQIVAVSIHSILLDIYFILRSHKGIYSPKLVCGYFGFRHNECLRHYFCKIIKTHTDSFYIKSNPDERRIYIDKQIDLNKLFGHKVEPAKLGKLQEPPEWEDDISRTIQKIEFRNKQSRKKKPSKKSRKTHKSVNQSFMTKHSRQVSID